MLPLLSLGHWGRGGRQTRPDITIAATCMADHPAFTAFWMLGSLVASILGGRTESGFELNGLSAIVFFASIIASFVVFNKHLGGTISNRLLKAKR
ncbi:hypothetical protein [Agrobacterium sp. SORGH_AS 787]|uniref:hypothetical protein n=1 Tax=Agrobacterium sp. SORGH_AS 787 TaxID=3041775 RepID=UPI00278A386C|nr:hypothetical protein [Rhizobium sp. SORGH_AS_0787]